MDKFNPWHLMFLIWGVNIVALKTYPRIFLAEGERDSWIALIISSVIYFIFYVFIMKVWKKSKEKKMSFIYKQAFGNTLGNILMALFVVTLFLTLVESSSVEADAMHQNMSIETPKWSYLIFVVLPAMYVVKKDIVTIVTISIIGIIFISIAGINLGIFTASNKSIEMLFPILQDGITTGFIKCIIKTLSLYGAGVIILPYMSKIEDKRNNLIKAVIIALIYLIQMEVTSTTGILMTFTPQRAISMNYPKLIQTQLVSLYQFFDFGELYVMLQMVGGWVLKYILTFYSIILILLEYNVSKTQKSISIVVISVLAYISSYFASSNSLMLFRLLNYFQYVCLLNFIIVPLAAFSIISIKMRLNLLPTVDEVGEKT